LVVGRTARIIGLVIPNGTTCLRADHDPCTTTVIWWDATSLNTLLNNALVDGCPAPGGRRGARHPSCYASRIEGRWIEGSVHYRFQLVPLHTKDQTQRTVGVIDDRPRENPKGWPRLLAARLLQRACRRRESASHESPPPPKR
jgi:hypothetical protein